MELHPIKISPVVLSTMSLARTSPSILFCSYSKCFNLVLSIFLICLALILSPFLTITSPLYEISMGVTLPINLLGINWS